MRQACGLAGQQAFRTLTYSAKPPCSSSASTLSPGRNRVTPLPTASTSPAMSQQRMRISGSGAEAMSLYYHVANKEDILDGIADAVAAEINDVVDATVAPGPPGRRPSAAGSCPPGGPAPPSLGPWVFETRSTTSPAVLLYHDRLVKLMRDGGFSHDLTHHALHALGSRALGFAQEVFQPGGGSGDEEAAAALESMAAKISRLVGMLMDVATTIRGQRWAGVTTRPSSNSGLT
jgi:hypothetical protein